MKSTRLFVAALVVPAVSATAQTRTPDAVRQLDAYVAKAVQDWHVAGLAIAVVYKGQLVFAKGYGLREAGKPEPVDTQTLFAIASTTKAMTAAALGMLVDEGKVRWDDPVARYLPSFQMYDPWITREITVRDLLTHRAGLPNADFLWTGGDNSREEIVRRVRFIRPAYTFRAGYTYQNVMYLVAGQVVAAASGMSWDDFIRTRIFEPLGMTRSVTTQRAVGDAANVAAPHWLSEDTARVIRNSLADGIGPAGSVWSSVADMAKWMRFLLDSGRVDGRPLLQPRTWAELFEPQTILHGQGSPPLQLAQPHWRTYALGWFQHDYHGRKLDYHTGSLSGMIAIHGLLRDDQLGVYILGNTDHAEVRHALMYKTLDLFLGLPTRDWSAELLALYSAADARGDSATMREDTRRVPNTRPTLALERYTGTFVDSLYGAVTVTMEGENLRLRSSSTQAATLEHWQYDTFRTRWDDWWRGRGSVTFIVGPNGSADRLEIGGFTLRRRNP
jgi:CubicO group peptidase (beta-lactamase class C family)